MTELLRAFSQIDQTLVSAVEPGTQTITVIEDIQAASITAWIRNVLHKADDEAIKSMDLKKAAGVYLVKGKYKILEFLESHQAKEEARRRTVLRQDLEALAAEVSPQLVAPAIDVRQLEGPMNEVQSAKRRLTNGEKLTIKGVGQPEMVLDTAASNPVAVEAESAETTEDVDGGDAEMLLLIRKPDLIGKAKWEFKHGAQTIRAGVEDERWMAKFHRGEETILPGSEMRAKVVLNYERDQSGKLVGVDYSIAKVLELVPPSPSDQAALFPEAERP